MKLLRLLVHFGLAGLLTSCYDSNQRIEFKENGGGNISYSIDFSKGINMLKVFIPDSIQKSPEFSRKIDTTINLLKAMPDSMKHKKSEESLKLLSSTIMKAEMDMSGNKFKIEFNGTSENEKDMRYRLQNFEKEIAQSDAVPTGSQGLAGASASFSNDYFQYEYRKGFFKRMVDTVLFRNSLKENESMYEMVRDAGLDANYKIELLFPKKIKKYKSTKLVLSNDKKSATLKYTLKEAMNNPSIMNVEVEY